MYTLYWAKRLALSPLLIFSPRYSTMRVPRGMSVTANSPCRSIGDVPTRTSVIRASLTLGDAGCGSVSDAAWSLAIIVRLSVACLPSALALQSRKNLFRRERQVHHPHTNGIANGVGEGGSNRGVTAFADAFALVRCWAWARLKQHRHQLWNILDGRYLVLAQA